MSLLSGDSGTSLPAVDRQRLGAVASVYAAILNLRLAPKLATELHLLARLLMVDEHVQLIAQHGVTSPPPAAPLPPSASTSSLSAAGAPGEKTDSSPLHPPLFESGRSPLRFVVG